MKTSVKIIIFMVMVFGVFYFKDEIINTLTEPAKKTTSIKQVIIPKDNAYKIFASEYAYVQNTNKFIPKEKQDIMNIVYTVLNSGWDTFTFYCPKEYDECVNDVTSITNDNELLSNINNYVHPFNSFKTIETNYTTSGEVTFVVHKLYNNEMIEELNKKVDEIIINNIYDNMTDREKIKVIHDYIINNTKYDTEKISGVTRGNSNNAYGVLTTGYGICSGYTDAMAIFLNKMNIQNIKVSSDKHIWNLVFVDGKWKHLDLTFDDPVTDPPEDIISEDYFLIDSETIIKQDNTNQHNYDKEVFVEAN